MRAHRRSAWLVAAVALVLGACSAATVPPAPAPQPATAVTPAPTPTPEPVAATIYRQLVERLNAGDVPAALALFTDDVVRKGGRACRPQCVGKAALQKEYETQQADHTQVVVIAGTVEISGSRLTAKEEVRADTFRKAGAERIIVLKTIEVRDDRIAFIESATDTSDAQTAAFVKAQAAGASPSPSGR